MSPRADQLLQLNRRHSGGVLLTERQRPVPGLRRIRDRFASDHVQCHEPVHGTADRSLYRRPRRWPRRRGRHGYRHRLRFDAKACRHQRRLCDVHQGPAPLPTLPRKRGRVGVGAALEHVGGWLRRHARPTPTPQSARTGPRPRVRRCRRRRLSLLAGYTGGLCARWRRHRLPASTTAAPAAPTCSRPAPSCARILGRLTFGGARLRLAGCHDRSHARRRRHRSAARALQCECAGQGAVEGGYRFVSCRCSAASA